MEYKTKDSGKREEFESGMVRDTNENKPRYDLLFPIGIPWNETISVKLISNFLSDAELELCSLIGKWYNTDVLDNNFIQIIKEQEKDILTRTALLMTRGAEKYSERNWELASGESELRRFKISAVRHFCQYMNNEEDEDHISATIFNILGYETTKYKIDEAKRKNK